MTLPINCPHSKDGWCQVCAKRMGDDLRKAQEAALRWYEAASPYGTPEALRDALSARPEAEEKAIETRLNDDKTLDEVVASGATFHLEQMDRDHWWMEVGVGGKAISVWLKSKTTIRATYEWRHYQPLPQKER
jgi:hypothetical protein